LPALAGPAGLRPEAASGRAEAQSFPFPGIVLSAAPQKAVSEPLARPAAGAAQAAEVLPRVGPAEASGAEVGPQREALQVARPSERPQAVLPWGLLSWVCRRDPILPLLAPSPAVRFAHAMVSLRIASL